MLNDGGYRVNSSVYQYFNIFGNRDIDVLRVNVLKIKIDYQKDLGCHVI